MNTSDRRSGAMSVTFAYTKAYKEALDRYSAELSEAGNIDFAAFDIDERGAEYIARSAKDGHSLFIGVIAEAPPDGDTAARLIAAAPVYLLTPGGVISRLLPSGAQMLPEGTTVCDIARRETEQRIDALISSPNASDSAEELSRGEDDGEWSEGRAPWDRTPVQKRADNVSMLLMLIGFAGFFVVAELLDYLPCGRDPTILMLYFFAWLFLSFSVGKALGGKM